MAILSSLFRSKRYCSSGVGNYAELARISDYDLRHTAVGLDGPRHTDAFAFVGVLWLAKLGALTAPDERRKDVLGVGLLQVEKRGQPLAPCGKGRIGDDATHGRGFPDMVLGLDSRESCGVALLGNERHTEEEYPECTDEAVTTPMVHGSLLVPLGGRLGKAGIPSFAKESAQHATRALRILYKEEGEHNEKIIRKRKHPVVMWSNLTRTGPNAPFLEDSCPGVSLAAPLLVRARLTRQRGPQHGDTEHRRRSRAGLCGSTSGGSHCLPAAAPTVRACGGRRRRGQQGKSRLLTRPHSASSVRVPRG